MNKNQLSGIISNALEKVLVDGTGMLPFVKPEIEDIVARVNRLSGGNLGMAHPKDFFRPQLLVDVLDQASKDYTNSAIFVAATTGGISGTIGIAGMAVDIPILVSAAVGLVRRQALVYGFTEIEDGKADETDKINLLVAFGAALGADVAAAKIGERVAIEAGRFVAVQTAKRYLLRQVSEEMAIKILYSWIPRALPVVAVAGNALLDGLFLNAFGWRCGKYYRARHTLVRSQAAHGKKLEEVVDASAPSRRYVPPAEPVADMPA